MYLQQILEVAIGLVFVWLILSMATMSLLEWISNILNLRANGLEKVITRMLGNKDLMNAFYNYPLITNLYEKPKKRGQKGRLPTYIPPNKFSATLFELIAQAGAENSPVQTMTGNIQDQLGSVGSPEQQKLAREDWKAILETAGNITASGQGSSALDSLKFQIQAFGEKYPELSAGVARLTPQLDSYYGQFVDEQSTAPASSADTGLAMRQFRLGMLALQQTNPPLSESINAIYRQTEVRPLQGDQANTTHVNLESWFNDAMDQLSGAYKRRARGIAFTIGLILALLLNVDSVNVANSLWRDPTLRQALITQAQSYTASAASQPAATSPFENIPQLQTQLQALNIPFLWTFNPIDTAGGQCSLLPIRTGQVMGIPARDNQGQPACYAINNLPVDLNGLLAKLLGMLITGLAAAQGAPFWFDILKKFLNVNTTNSKPAAQTTAG